MCDTKRDLMTYDQYAKKLLSEKNILIYLINAFVPEFRDMEPSEIKKYICDNSDGLSSDTVTSSGTGIEDLDDAGRIEYDVKFDLSLPEKYKTDMRYRILVNIEPQNDNREYKPVQRGLYYTTRMISSQHGVYFKGSDYHRIQQVYSIWICFNPPKAEEGSVRIYEINERNISGDYREDKTTYDLMKVIVINLGGETPEKIDYNTKRAVRILNLLFRSRESAVKKLTELKDIYDVDITNSMSKEVGDMCNVEDAPYTHGRNDGIEIGYAKGLNESIDQEKINTARRMLSSGKYSLDEISDVTGLSVEEIKKISE